MSDVIILIEQLSKAYNKASSQALLVLDKVNFQLNEGEIVALLGKSGSGKSTLLRIIAGLITPTSGKVVYRGQAVTRPGKGHRHGVSVFCAVALGLLCWKMWNWAWKRKASSVKKRRRRAIEAIDIIGLDGFESAYLGNCPVGCASVLVLLAPW